MTFAWLPYPFAGHFRITRFRNREAALKFCDMTVPHMCHVHVRMVNVYEILTTAAAVAFIIIGMIWR